MASSDQLLASSLGIFNMFACISVFVIVSVLNLDGATEKSATGSLGRDYGILGQYRRRLRVA